METNNNSKFNFYTQNGWAGSNYDNKLSTKDTAPVKATNEESEISQKKGEENGYKVESYFTKDKTALEELIEKTINNLSAK